MGLGCRAKVFRCRYGKQVVVVGIDGAASNDVDCLAKELDDYITKKDFLLLEERRRSSFTPKEDS